MITRRPLSLALTIATAVTALACDPDDGGPAPIYPADWATSFTKVRDCRQTPEHDLNHVTLHVDPASVALWQQCVVYDSTCTERFAEGATFIKAEYSDSACTDLVLVSAAKKSSDAAFADVGGWHWQEVQADGRVAEDGAVERCARCHESCDGSYDHRCVMDP